jgi:hypothetical protein
MTIYSSIMGGETWLLSTKLFYAVYVVFQQNIQAKIWNLLEILLMNYLL